MTFKSLRPFLKDDRKFSVRILDIKEQKKIEQMQLS